MVLGAFACQGARSQQAPDASPAKAKASGQQVTLPVVVRDKKGAIVSSVQKSDLSLTQDGRPQTIESLSRDAASQPLMIGLMVDTSRPMGGAMEAERKALGGFVDQALPADGSKDQAFLIHFDREVELLEDFTASRDKLHQEIEDMGSTGTRHDDRGGPETTGDERTPTTNRRATDQLYDAIYLASDEVMKDKKGRKVLVIFSNGGDRGSKETLNDAVDAADKAGLSIYTIFFKGEQEKSGFAEYPGSHRGGGYPGGGGGYPGGGGGYPGGGGNRKQPEPTSGNGIDGKKIMQEIATRTGGHAYEAKHTSDLEPIYKLISEELRNQYLLTYTPDKEDKDGGFHKIAVTAGNKDWTVSAPEGYYAPEK
ncbi:VWA domain-containing protein [Occallatibacter riparius]|uniref:VWA domain-containing protein n=1 Tax=Occallatibacter riparius TaxID=1002689 RepID=A0A9J7BL33_9BACT|nr:VWA domain-containing protein [Occallatibacter riparius]UWZ83536.1 VWA domain-containing protein [Occallatibacter riparius]